MEAKLPILEVLNLRVSFQDPVNPSQKIEAVRGISFEAAEGSFTAIVGESGSGKSVTSLALTRLTQTKDVTGQVFWRGSRTKKDLLTLNDSELLDVRGKEIAYVFQDPASSLNPVLRVGPQIAEAYRAHFDVSRDHSKNRALEYLEAVQMKDALRVYQSYPHELSGGMRQRAAIAMALIAEPRLLIADEPTTALDANVETEILNLLLKIKRERKLTILFITHNMAHACSYSDVIYVMNQGKMTERLTPSADGFHPRTDYAKKLFAASFWNVPPKSILPCVSPNVIPEIFNRESNLKTNHP